MNPAYINNGLLLAALGFAADKHRNQRRKDLGATPYINHPISLAVVLSQEGGIDDVGVLCGALLHDIVEDTDVTIDELIDRFGSEIARLVAQVSDDTSLDKAERKNLQIEHAPSLCNSAKLIKLADKICNLRDIATIPPAGWSVERKLDYCEFAKRVVDGLRGIHPNLEELFDDTYTNLVDQLSQEGMS